MPKKKKKKNKNSHKNASEANSTSSTPWWFFQKVLDLSFIKKYIYIYI